MIHGLDEHIGAIAIYADTRDQEGAIAEARCSHNMNDPHHRKIELQAPADLTYLLTNIRASAQQKIDSAFPPSAAPKGEEDALRAKVEEFVQTVSPPTPPQRNPAK